MHHLAIVDDNETWCFVLALRLQQQGYVTGTFTNAHAFLRKVDQFDLVIIDFSMPAPRYQQSMDGPELICQVKHQFNHPPLLILVSSFFTEDILDNAALVCPEADAVLSKQTDSTELLHQIEQLLKHKAPSQQYISRSNSSNPADASTYAISHCYENIPLLQAAGHPEQNLM